MNPNPNEIISKTTFHLSLLPEFTEGEKEIAKIQKKTKDTAQEEDIVQSMGGMVL